MQNVLWSIGIVQLDRGANADTAVAKIADVDLSADDLTVIAFDLIDIVTGDTDREVCLSSTTCS